MSGSREIAVVVPRYGEAINGGAESLARAYAHRLAQHARVTVLTSCALDYRTWSDHFAPGEEMDGPVRVLRFPVPAPRDEVAFDALSAEVLTGSPDRAAEIAWMDAQGPVVPGLEDHLRLHGDEYDAVVFVPYLYATTVRALPLVAERSVLVGAFHDEPPLKLTIFDDVVARAKAIVVSTPEERRLAIRRFGLDAAAPYTVGAGIDAAPVVDPDQFRRAYAIDGDYVLALGRIDPSKGSQDLIGLHEEYRRRRPDGLDLVMVGRAVMDIPERPWLHAPGFVDDDMKASALAGCTALVSASPFESLSLVLLEAWVHGRPTLVTSRSDVLVGQTRRSGGGLWFTDVDEYCAGLDLLASRPALAWGLGRAGWRFARDLDWDTVTRRLLEAVDAR